MEKSPVPVMVQVLLERVLSPEKLNAWFERTAVEQYTRELLFSTVFELMNLVIFKTFPSVHAAYRESGEQIGVSIASVYNKLNLTNLPKSVASAKLIAELYRKRWSIETMFQELEAHLHSEINTLGYPKAALFGFCVALVAYNALAVVKAALRKVHGEATIDNELSGYYRSQEKDFGKARYIRILRKA
jgi:IS4 transposase